MTIVEPTKEKRGISRLGTLALALGVLSLLSGCVVYVPYSSPPPHYHYWR